MPDDKQQPLSPDEEPALPQDEDDAPEELEPLIDEEGSRQTPLP